LLTFSSATASGTARLRAGRHPCRRALCTRPAARRDQTGAAAWLGQALLLMEGLPASTGAP